MRLGIPGGAYLIHGTNRPAGVGMQVTHGCMRLYPEDIERLFGMVHVNTPVMIVNQPYKWGWHDGQLLIEVHPPLQEDAVEPPTLTDLTRLIVEATRSQPLAIDWGAAEQIWREARGVPAAVSVGGTGAVGKRIRASTLKQKAPQRCRRGAFLVVKVRCRLLRHRLFEHAIHLRAVRIAALLRSLRRGQGLIGRVLRRGGSLLCGGRGTACAIRSGLHAIDVTGQPGDLRLERVDFRLHGLQIGAAGAQREDGGSDAHLQDIGHEIVLQSVAWNVYKPLLRLHGGRRSFPTARLTMRIVTYQRISLKHSMSCRRGSDK